MYRAVFFVCISAALGKVVTTQGYPVQQYIHVTGLPPYREPPPHPPIQQALVPASLPQPKLEPIPIPNPTYSPPPTFSQPPALLTAPAPTIPLKKEAPTLDSNVLNNLAIALQLLIVSNILNLPPKESNSEIATKMALALEPCRETAYYAPSSFIIESPKYEIGTKYSMEPMMSPQIEAVPIPNVNYLGSTGYGETNVYRTFTPTSQASPRAEMGFMSPYDAINNSPYSDPNLLSSYRSAPSKRDFQSPYAAILSDNKDYSMFEFF